MVNSPNRFRNRFPSISASSFAGVLAHPTVPWVRRCVSISLGFALVFTVANVCALHWIGAREMGGSETGLGLGSVVSGVWVTSAGYGLIGLCFGLCTAPLSRHAKLRWLSAAVLGLALAGALLANLVSAVLCVYSGSYLSYGALQFTLNSFAHVSGAALSGHAGALLTIGLVSLLLWVGIAAALGREVTTETPSRQKRLLTVSLSAPAFIAILGFDGFDEPSFEHEVWETTPELAFYSSFERMMQSLAKRTTSERVTAPGPRREVDDIWKHASQPTRKPNVLLLMLESVSTQYLGYLGDSAGVTPNLDKLARRALSFERVWSTATHSNYAQMAVLSSLLPRRGRGLDTYQRLDYPRFLLHDALAHFGYATATISSQDETWQGMLRFQSTGTQTHFVDARSHEGRHIDIISEQVVPDEATASKAINWLREQSGPWSLYVNFQATHFPYRLPPEAPRPFAPHEPTAAFNYLRYAEEDEIIAKNRYKNALAYVDAQIGRIARELADTGQLDDTLWVITSDHGEMFHEHGMVTHGRTLYESEARVPLLFHWPKGIEPGTSQTPVSTLDVLPTVLAALGVPTHPAHQGSPLMAAGRATDSRRAVLLNIQGLRSVEGVVCWPFKLVRDVATGRQHLFDLDADPAELRDLSSAAPGRAKPLARLLRGVMDEQDAYHRLGSVERHERFAPRLPTCPN